jgi:hypothetical protein
MNVLALIRTKAQKKDALKRAQMAAAKAAPVCLVYRGVGYEKAA